MELCPLRQDSVLRLCASSPLSEEIPGGSPLRVMSVSIRLNDRLNSKTDSGQPLLSSSRRSRLLLPRTSRETEAKADKNLVSGQAGVSCVHYDVVTRSCATLLRRW